MAESQTCPRCGRALSATAPRGLCSHCLYEGFLALPDASPSGDAAPEEPGASAGLSGNIRYFGDYELIGEVAQGGMGVVFRARQRSLDRLVAVKLIRAGYLARPEQVERFRREARAAASLQHPHIVAIHEIGEHRGHHYYSMDLVDGRSLAQVANGRPQPPEQAARWLHTVAESIHYAHGRGVIHRDLKPSNILIDTDGAPHVADFGLAKLVSDSADSETATGAILGSPNYMPPEQAQGRHDDISPRSDLWSLGAILYELLTGRPPFNAESSVETLRLVCTQEPVAPRRLIPAIPRDLETICLKCLEKSPARRYASAQEVADELGRFLRHEPIRARPVRVPEKVFKWARRHPARAGLIAVSGIALLAYVTQFFDHHARLREQRYASEILLAGQAIERGQLGVADGVLLRGIDSAGSVFERDLRGFEWRYLQGLLAGDQVHTLSVTGILERLAFVAGGSTLRADLKDGGAVAWETHGWKPVAVPVPTPETPAAHPTGLAASDPNRLAAELGMDPPPDWIASNSDGRLLATRTSGSRKILLWRRIRSTPKPLSYAEILGLHSPFTAMAFSPDDAFLATANADGLIQLWNGWPGTQAPNVLVTSARNAAERELRLRLVPRAGDLAGSYRGHRGEPRQLAFSPDGEWLASGASDGTVRIWRGRPPLEQNFIPDIAPPLAFSADGLWLHARSPEGQPVWLDSVRLTPGRSAAAGPGSMAVPPPAVRFTSLDDRGIDLLDLRMGSAVMRLEGHQTRVTAVALSHDGRTIATGDRNGVVKLWQRATGRELMTLDARNEIRQLVFAPDATLLVGADTAGLMWYWRAPLLDATSGQRPALPPSNQPRPIQ